jgi:pyruvate formate lyase activating enzyme
MIIGAKRHAFLSFFLSSFAPLCEHLGEEVNVFAFYQKKGSDGLQCELCPHSCVLSPGKSGICKVRFNRSDKGDIPFYGHITALAEDPMEKKPLYHFRPGTEILSVGFLGCNLRCPFCQSWHISQTTESPARRITPQELVTRAKECGALAYTYSEPLVHIEFLLDCMTEARKAGIANVLVTNGCIKSAATEKVLALTDAANIDLKCFSRETYSKVLGGDLDTVLDFIRTAHNKNVHVELTTLVVPGLNDSRQELDACVDFIESLGSGPQNAQIPWHLSAYHPDWKWNAPPTPQDFLLETAEHARSRLAYVYAGNIFGEKNDTLCSFCGKTLVSRRGYRIDTNCLRIVKEKDSLAATCAFCGKAAPFWV